MLLDAKLEQLASDYNCSDFCNVPLSELLRCADEAMDLLDIIYLYVDFAQVDPKYRGIVLDIIEATRDKRLDD